jgi:tripartite ATP-independent transporter DctM subunit
MEWWLILFIILVGILFLFAIGVPVAFSFFVLNILAAFLLWGGQKGLDQFILSLYGSINFNMLPIPLFILMGEVMFRTGVAPRMIETLDKWIGRVPGRLSLLTVFGGAVFGALSGAATASVAMLGTVMLPEMEKRGYKPPMTLGPIMGSAGLDIMIPPSALGVILASLARFSIGKFLFAIIVPGLIMAVVYAAYVVIRCLLQPSLAPVYEVPRIPLRVKIVDTIRYILPLGSIIFLAMGVIYLGVATPNEAAALGAAGCYVLAFFYRKLQWAVVKDTFMDSTKISAMIFLVLAGAVAFSQIMAYTGATNGLVDFLLTLPLSPLLLMITMQMALLIMGCFIDALPIMIITVPIFMPVIKTLGFDPIWFGAIMLLNMQMGTLSPPFGLVLFVMKGVAPPHIKMLDIYKAVYPIIGLDLIVMAIMIAFPQVVLWLPGLMIK